MRAHAAALGATVGALLLWPIPLLVAATGVVLALARRSAATRISVVTEWPVRAPSLHSTSSRSPSAATAPPTGAMSGGIAKVSTLR